MSKETLFFEMDSSCLKIKEVLENHDFLKLELWAISDTYPNNNNSHFPLTTMEANVVSGMFFNKPVLGKFNNRTDNYETHVYKRAYDPETQLEYYDFEDGERPLGLTRESDNIRIEKDENDTSWIVFTCVLWVKYNFRGVKKLLKSKKSKVSVEITVLESHDDENGVKIFDQWVYDGVTILGYKPNTKKEVKEGIENARLSILDKLNNYAFAQDLACVQFACAELDNIKPVVDEINSHLYIEKYNKGGVKMTSKKKEVELENLEVESKEDFSESKKVAGPLEEKLEDANKTVEGCKVEEAKECEKIKEEPADEKIEDETIKMDDSNKCDPEDDNKEGGEEDNKDDNENGDESEKCCGNFEEQQVKFDALTAEFETLKTDHVALREEFEKISQENIQYAQKIEVYEKAEKEARIKALCSEVKTMAEREGFDASIIDSLIEKCKTEVFVSKEDAVREIAYITFTHKAEKKTEDAEKSEFSTKVTDTPNASSQKEVKTSFDKLKDYIKN